MRRLMAILIRKTKRLAKVVAHRAVSAQNVLNVMANVASAVNVVSVLSVVQGVALKLLA